MTLDDLAKAHWTNTEASEALASLTESFLARQPEGSTLGTTALLRALGAAPEQFKALASHLGSARDNGFLPGRFTRGKKGSFGKPSVIWICGPEGATSPAKPELTNEERRAKLKELLGEEEYKRLYSSNTENSA